jgi:hypothetical protein
LFRHLRAYTGIAVKGYVHRMVEHGKTSILTRKEITSTD